MSTKLNLLNFNRAQLADFFTQRGEKPFRAQQFFRWVHQQGITEFADMTNLSKSLRAWLAEHAEVRVPEVVTEQVSQDGTRKWLLRIDSGNCIETVFIPQRGRGTLCISSQVGCAVDCSFCATGKQGFNRNLTVAEIIGQVWLAVRLLSQAEGAHDKTVTNVVLMGMGEPLLNFDAVVTAMDIMLDDLAYGLSKYRVTLSTSGILPRMEQLLQRSPVALAVSLHAPTNALRNQLVPINKKYPLEQLIELCKRYYRNEPRRTITFEYIMLADVNDTPQHAQQLCHLLEGVPAKVNLIPFNPVAGVEYKTSTPAAVDAFQQIMMQAGIPTITRLTRGDDIAAACGQLVGDVKARGKYRRVIPLVKEIAA